ncbi:MAG TPA: M14 metallopeptidase family protein [Candidatus Acidoferrales bacterium]|nr:M14 metallopeptidase family protein [Candidatus Acidoferrales bacterium]
MTLRIPALLLAAWSALAAVPTPKSYFGHEIGQDNTVLDWNKVAGYFNELAKSSDRIRVEELGKTADNRPFIAATIADRETLRHLDRYLAIQQKLADPRQTSRAEAEKLFLEGKTVVLITCSIHATEIASTHTAVEFAYRLLTEDKPHYRAILKDTILLLVPSLNPDGVDIVTRWYRKTLGTPFEGSQPPELWHKYVGHDNNRDWYIFSQPETRHTISKLHNVWHPQIVYDVHQQAANASRIFVPPWLDPVEPNIDAILMQEMNMFGTMIATDLTAAGKTGVSIHAAYDFWSPARHYQAFHTGLRLLTESASVRIASPVTLTADQIADTALGYNPRERSWNYLEPWMGGTWRLRDIIDYQLIAFESVLYNAAVHREELLRNFYRVGERQIARTEPWGFVIPADQRDPGATRKLIETLQFGQVEIGKGEDGSAVIAMHQPYSGWAKSLLERQRYPEDRLYPGGPPKRPYDVTAHTLPLLMGVEVKAVNQPVTSAGQWQAPAAQTAPTSKTARAVQTAPAARAGAPLPASDTDSWMAVNRAWADGKSVWRDPASGNFSLVEQAGWRQVRRPRVALYQPWQANMDEGWTRWLLERFGFAYTGVRNADLQSGGLKQKFDAIVFADQAANSIENGYAPGAMPPEYTGGVGPKGADALKEFATAGGTLVFLNAATGYAISRLGIQAKSVTPAGESSEFYSPGSLLNVQVDTHSPLAYGVPAAIAIWSEHSPAWDTRLPVVARYPDSHLLASGWLVGEKVIAGRAAMIDAPLGSGHVVLFGMRPQYRAQSYLTFKMFFNALVYP